MRVELSRRRRRPRKRRVAPARDRAVLVFPTNDDGPTQPLGPFTQQGATSVFLREGRKGHKVQMVSYEAALLVAEASDEAAS